MQTTMTGIMPKSQDASAMQTSPVSPSSLMPKSNTPHDTPGPPARTQTTAAPPLSSSKNPGATNKHPRQAMLAESFSPSFRNLKLFRLVFHGLGALVRKRKQMRVRLHINDPVRYHWSPIHRRT